LLYSTAAQVDDLSAHPRRPKEQLVGFCSNEEKAKQRMGGIDSVNIYVNSSIATPATLNQPVPLSRHFFSNKQQTISFSESSRLECIISIWTSNQVWEHFRDSHKTTEWII
jgi:hypothetical protein